jgi:hypothetical protein
MTDRPKWAGGGADDDERSEWIDIDQVGDDRVAANRSDGGRVVRRAINYRTSD